MWNGPPVTPGLGWHTSTSPSWGGSATGFTGPGLKREVSVGRDRVSRFTERVPFLRRPLRTRRRMENINYKSSLICRGGCVSPMSSILFMKYRTSLVSTEGQSPGLRFGDICVTYLEWGCPCLSCSMSRVPPSRRDVPRRTPRVRPVACERCRGPPWRVRSRAHIDVRDQLLLSS